MPVEINREKLIQQLKDIKEKKESPIYKYFYFDGIKITNVPCYADKHNVGEFLVSAKTLENVCRIVSEIQKENNAIIVVEYSE